MGKYCNQDVAIKVAATSEMGLEGWTAELMSLKKLHHNNVIRFLGSIYNPSPLMYCLVLEYCDGGDLSVALSSVTPPQFFTNVSAGVANGIFYLHKMKYMHRDIKPGNVLLSGDPKSGKFVAKLTDFGLSRFFETRPPAPEDMVDDDKPKTKGRNPIRNTAIPTRYIQCTEKSVL